MKEKQKRITNKFYLEFLEKGLITTIKKEHIEQAAKKISGEYFLMYKIMLYILYLTGARPVEVLNLKGSDVTKKGGYIIIQVPAAKNGLTRPIYLKLKNPFVKEIYDFAKGFFPQMFLFWGIRGTYTRTRINKKGVVKTYIETSRRFRYHCGKWFKDILEVNTSVTPYHLRHNRFSRLSENGATAEDLRLLKGAKTYASVTPYIHLSSERSKKMSGKIQ